MNKLPLLCATSAGVASPEGTSSPSHGTACCHSEVSSNTVMHTHSSIVALFTEIQEARCLRFSCIAVSPNPVKSE